MIQNYNVDRFGKVNNFATLNIDELSQSLKQNIEKEKASKRVKKTQVNYDRVNGL